MCCFQETGLYEYKVFGVLTTCTPELCADVYMDLTYRKDWDNYVKGKKKRHNSKTIVIVIAIHVNFPSSLLLKNKSSYLNVISSAL